MLQLKVFRKFRACDVTCIASCDIELIAMSVVAKTGASQLVEEVKCFRALVQLTYADAKRNAMVGGCQGVRKVLGFRGSCREF